MPELITRDTSPQAEPIIYELAATEKWTLLAASCIYDGTSLNSDFIPAMAIVAPNTLQFLYFGQDLLVAQHGIVLVTFAPHLSPTPGKIAVTTFYAQTGMPTLPLTGGYQVWFGAMTPTSFFPDVTIVYTQMTMYVQGTGVGEGRFNPAGALPLMIRRGG